MAVAAQRSSLITDAGGDKKKAPPQRELWSSRGAFYCVTAGAAIGFGNVWRFPGLSLRYGGGAFFVPYILGIIMVGIPLTVLEVGLGQFFQTGAIGVFGGLHPRLRGIGVCSLACSIIVSSYFAVFIAWVANALVSTWDDDAPWGTPGLTSDEAISYFHSNIVGMDTVTTRDLKPTRIVGKNIGYSAMIWIFVFMVTSLGLRNVGRIAIVTMVLPFVILFMFVGRAVTLEGAGAGVMAYIGEWDFSAISGEVWPVAITQVYFSNSLTIGLLTVYGSHCKRDEPVFLNSCVLVALNSVYSVITGFAVFCALGHLAHLEGVTVSDLPHNGFNLIFGTWPVVLGTLPGGIHWIRLLFFNLFMLGIDSAFAYVEIFVTMLQDTMYFRDVSRRNLILGCIALNFLFGMLYCTDSGLYFLNVMDFYLNFTMLLMGFLESFGAGWAYGILDMFQSIGVRAWTMHMMGNFVPVLIGCVFWGMKDRFPYYYGFMCIVILWPFFLVMTHYFLMQRMAKQPGRWTVRSIWFETFFGNVVRLRDELQPVIGNIPFMWAFMLKYCVPHATILCFFELLTSPTFGAGTYDGYAIRPYQLMGLLCVIFVAFLFVVGVVVPEVYEPLAVPQTKVVLRGANVSEQKETDGSIDRPSERGSLTDRAVKETDAMLSSEMISLESDSEEIIF